jgi:chorismate-pyruvate lyase
MNANSHAEWSPDLSRLIALFYDDAAELGQFEEVAGGQMPRVARRLLDHEQHMTVTVEAFHKCPVDVEVETDRIEDGLYVRKIVLHRQSDGRPVQFGLVRMDFRFVTSEVRRAIESRSIPLGRVLIDHNVLTRVELFALWKVEAGPDLAKLLQAAPGETLYGRTAQIHCDDQPAVELLEILAPVSLTEG